VSPVVPNHGVLAKGGVTTAGDIAKNTIELEGKNLTSLVGSQLQVGHQRGVVVGNHQARRLKTLGLVD